jgi:DeoR/GlpR family transcriptional regulator of sugar metabolism
MIDDRQRTILEHLNSDQRIWINDLAEKLQIPIMTIKQDLIDMEQKGLLKRTYGGAVHPHSSRPHQSPSNASDETSNQDAAIAKRAASYIKDRDIVFIGNTVIHYMMLKYISDSISCTVVTNSLKVANALKDKENMITYLLGGKVTTTGIATDTYTVEQLKRYSLDRCFLAGGGFSSNGISSSSPANASFISSLISVSRQIIALSPYYRLGTDALAKAEPISLVDILITDEMADPNALSDIENKDVEIIIAH